MKQKKKLLSEETFSEEQMLQWHPAFYADLQIELKEEQKKLEFKNEYQLGSKPMAIDVLVIKKISDEPIYKNIGRLFRKYNVIEYKSPTDYISIDDFYKVYGYTCFYKADTGKVDEIQIQDMTITFVSKKYPRKLIKHLKEIRKYNVENLEEGIYYVTGDMIPIQILVTGQMSSKKNLWLYSLTDSLNETDVRRRLINDYKANKENNLYQSAMEIIVKANETKFKEEKSDMCNALLDLMKEEIDEMVEKGEKKGENRINQLNLKLSELNRMDDILKATMDREYQEKLLKEFGL